MADTKTRWESAGATAWGSYLTEAHRRVLVRALGLAPGQGAAMDVGCEGGRWSRYLVERFTPTICTDIDPAVLGICAERLPQATCVLTGVADERFAVGDGELAMLVVFEVDPVVSAPWFSKEAARVLQTGGVLAFTHINPASLRGVAYRGLALVNRARREREFYRGPSYASVRRSLVRAGLEMVHEEGLAWPPFTRESDSRLIPAAVRLERALGLPRLVPVSPWVLGLARRV